MAQGATWLMYQNSLHIVLDAARKGADAELDLAERQAPLEHIKIARANRDVVYAACEQVEVEARALLEW